LYQITKRRILEDSTLNSQGLERAKSENDELIRSLAHMKQRRAKKLHVAFFVQWKRTAHDSK
jgi:hypothetical protein